MQHAITHGPSFALLRVDLAPGETIVGEAGSMVARHEELAMRVRLNAGDSRGFFAWVKALLVALVRRFIGGETLFVNHFTTARGGSVWLAPPLAGQIVHRHLNGELLLLSRGAYLAHAGALSIKLKFSGLRGLLAKQGAFFLAVSGQGDLWFSSYGGIEPVDVNGSYLVDNGHLVGYEGNLTFSIRSAGGGLLGLAASGEGLVCEFQGQGRLWLQTRNLASLVGWLGPLLPR